MQKMIIKLDNEKIKRVGKYSVDELCERIDEICFERCCAVEVQPDGSRVYTPRVPEEQHFAHIGLCYEVLSEFDWFASSVEKWLWYESESSVCDVLKEELEDEESVAFRKAYYV